MAEIHAIQNGNWADTSTWDLNRVPDVDDDVYLEGFTIILITENNINVKSLHNGEIASNNSAVNGGFFSADFIENVYFEFGYQNSDTIKSYNLNCQRITTNKTSLINIRATNSTVNIVGNIEVFSACTIVTCGLGRTQHTNIVGNVENNTNTSSGFYLSNNVTEITTITGNLKSINSYYELILFGNLYSFGGTLNLPRFTISGSIYYNDLSMGLARFGVNVSTSFTASDIIEWKNVSTPSVYSVQIVTKYQIDNIQQYPMESDVKNGVEYAYGLKEGNYLPNFPQVANVLKGVEYDDGNKVGTLEVIALSGATATADNISVVNLTEQEVNRVKNCATVSTVQKCFEDFKE